jgi:probable HAF family extracellular repeat protein
MQGATETFSFATVDVPDATGFTKAYSINNLGQVAGTYIGQNSLADGFVEDNGAFTTVAVPRTVLGTLTLTDVYGINDKGEVAGSYRAIGPGNSKGFVETEGNLTFMNVPGSLFTQIRGINDKGDVAGTYGDSNRKIHGFADHNGTFTSIDIPNASTTSAEGINNAGDIVGSYSAAGQGHGYIDHAGVLTTIDMPGAVSTDVSGINNEGMLVGTYTDTSMKSHGFIYDNGSFTTVDYPGASGTEAWGINDRGEIAGDYLDSNGDYHGFVANPLDPPAETACDSLRDLLASLPVSLDMKDFISSAQLITKGLTPQGNQYTHTDPLSGSNMGAFVCFGSSDTTAPNAAAAAIAHTATGM